MKKFIISILCVLTVISCGYDFYMNRPSVEQVVSLSKGDHTLDLASRASIGDNFYRAHLESDFYRGYADITYDGTAFKVDYRNLPISEEDMAKVKDDIYAIYYAGGYPYKSDTKRFGRTEMQNGVKMVYDTDGYLIYKVRYGNAQIAMYNIIGAYSIVINYKSGSTTY